LPNEPAGKRLGSLLVRRRIELDPAWRSRKAFAAEHNLLYRIVNDAENGNRFNFEPVTITAIEVAYRLAPGSLRRSLASGVLELADQPCRPSHLTLVPVDDVAAERRELAEQWAAMVTAPVGPELRELKAAIDAAPRGATGRDIFPDLPALAEIWDMRETPPQYRLLYAAVWLFTRRNPEQANKAG
jgi:hypothetical protein